MKNRIRKWKRDRLRDRIINSGRALRRLQVARAQCAWEDGDALDAMIDNQTRRHGRLITKFKEAF